jgi:hypothetical protein
MIFEVFCEPVEVLGVAVLVPILKEVSKDFPFEASCWVGRGTRGVEVEFI